MDEDYGEGRFSIFSEVSQFFHIHIRLNSFDYKVNWFFKFIIFSNPLLLNSYFSNLSVLIFAFVTII